MPRRAARTALRTVRLSQSLNDVLEKDAQSKNLSVNALISTILTRYAEWDRYTEKFGFVSVTKELFRTLLSSSTKDHLPQVAEALGRKLPKEVMQFFWRKADLQAFLLYIAAFSKYGGLAEYELHQEGEDYVVTAHHELGENWSIFLKHFLSAGIQSIFSTPPKFEVTSNTVIFRFTPR